MRKPSGVGKSFTAVIYNYTNKLLASLTSFDMTKHWEHSLIMYDQQIFVDILECRHYHCRHYPSVDIFLVSTLSLSTF